MNIKKNLSMVAVAAAFTLSFTACSKDDDADTTKPTITLNEPTDGEQLAQGAEIYFDADFEDNVELKNFKVDIHWAEGHTHSTQSVSPKAADATSWTFAQTYDISGLRNKHVHEHIDIPKDTPAGDYHLVVYCTDASGNESMSYLTFDVVSPASGQ